MRINAAFLESVIQDAYIIQGEFPQTVSFAVDSRHVNSGDIFVALPGNRQDGHEFLKDVVHLPIAGIMIRASKKDILHSLDVHALKNKLIIVVPDTLSALVSLAIAWRNRFDVPVVAITGSVGKTSTKNILGAILTHAGKNYLVAHGNQNTVVGVAINMLRLNESYHGAIFEVGINQRGEMARIAAMIRPTTAVITCIGHSHMEGLGSLIDIAAEKREIFKYFKEDNIGFINGDQAVLANVSYPHPVVKFGLKTTNQIQARKVVYDGDSTTIVLKIYKEKYTVRLPSNHVGIIVNSLACVAVAHHLGIEDTVIVEAIQKPVVVSGRFEKRLLKMNGGVLINDCYNASPESMKAALVSLQKITTDAQKIAVLGDMLELGTDSAFWHRQLGRFLRKVPTLNHLILVGSLVEWTHKTVPVGLRVEVVPNWQQAVSRVQDLIKQDSLILVKGSRGVGLDNLVNQLC